MGLEIVVGGEDSQSSGSGFPYRELYTMIYSFMNEGLLYYATTHYIRKCCEVNYKKPKREGYRGVLKALENFHRLEKYCGKIRRGIYLNVNDLIEFLINDLNPETLKGILEDSLKDCFHETHGFPLDNLMNLVYNEEAMSFFRSFLSFCSEYGKRLRRREKRLCKMSEDDGFKNIESYFKNIESYIFNDPLYKYLNNLLNKYLPEEYVVPVYVTCASWLYSIPEEEMWDAVRLGVEYGVNAAVKDDKPDIKSLYVILHKEFGDQARYVIPRFAEFVEFRIKDYKKRYKI